MTPIRFGTDGWRAVIAEGFTFDNVGRVAQATADYWNLHRPPGTEKRVIIGYDRRFLAGAFAQETASILAANGFEVLLSNSDAPTPAVSLAVKNQRAAGGVMITASHNPPAFNGYKLKAHFGGSADPELCRGVEACLDRSEVRGAGAYAAGLADGCIRRIDFRTPHLRAVKRLVDFKLIAQSGLRVAHDPLFGVGAGCFDTLLRGTRCTTMTLNAEHDPNFGGINPEPVEKNYRLAAALLRRDPQDVCIVTDGDADRVGAMDGRGRALSTHNVICLLLEHFIRQRGARGRVIKALTTTSMVDKICDEHGLPLVETGVGFKYICAEMLKGGVLLGFEESGGIGFPGHVPERDGILAGLMLLEALAAAGKPIGKCLSALEKHYGPHRYCRSDIHFPVERRAELMAALVKHPPSRLAKSPVARILDFDGVKMISEDGSWLMIRGSGTEPVLRVYAEAASDAGARGLVKFGVAAARKVGGP